MSEALDRSYINILGCELEQFTWEQETVCRFRCPLCGDSKKKAKKRRGHFYFDPDIDKYRFKCHNCPDASGWDLQQWLRLYNPTIYSAYIVDMFQDTRQNTNGYIKLGAAKPKKEEKRDASAVRTKSIVKRKKAVATDEALVLCCTPITDLPEDHYCRKYIVGRMIPERVWSLLYFTENFKTFATAMEPETPESAEKSPEDPRLVIPFFDARGNMTMAQGRSFDPKCDLRYITIKREDRTNKCYGLERLDFNRTKLVVEGPLDSLLLPNCLASADADLLKVNGDIYIPDNQPRNREIVRRVHKMIKQGVKVCLLPSSLDKHGKDINEYIINGVKTMDLLRIIAQNTHQGLRAELEFAKWKKV